MSFLSFMPIYIQVYQNKASPRNWLIPKLLAALCLFHLCLSILQSTVIPWFLPALEHQRTCKCVCTFPLLWKQSPFHRISPEGISPAAYGHHRGRASPPSVCAGSDPSIHCHWGMTHTKPIYRNDQDSIKQLQNMPDVSSSFTETAVQFEGICNYCPL